MGHTVTAGVCWVQSHDALTARGRAEPRSQTHNSLNDVHVPAVVVAAPQAQRDRDERSRGGGRDRGGPSGPPPRSNYDRIMDRSEVPSRALNMQRAPSSEMQLRPGGAAFGNRMRTGSPAPGAFF